MNQCADFHARCLAEGRRVKAKIIINGRFLTQPMTGVQRFAFQVISTIDALIDSGILAVRDRPVV